MKRESTAAARASGVRDLAARVVVRVARDDAYTAAALEAELERHPQLELRDRRLATELAYGVVRCRTALLARLADLAPRGLPTGDHAVMAHLLVAAYQFLVLDRVPAFAAVDEAVSAVKRERGPRVAGFVNAILRKLAKTPRRLARSEAVLAGVPPWLWARLVAAVGEPEARALLGCEPEADPSESEVGARLGDRRLLAGSVVEGEPATLPPAESFGGTTLRLRADRPLRFALDEAQRGRLSPLARQIQGLGAARRVPGWQAGDFSIQEEGAQVVSLLVGARPGERILDACAGRGQKTTLLRERVGELGEVWATDLYPDKLRALEGELARLGLAPVRTSAVDWTVGAASIPEGFDRVLVDAPCTGTGTLRRHPEALGRLEPNAPRRLGELAGQILRRAGSRARPGGRVLFAVCSVLPEEGQAVVAAVADLLEPVPFDVPAPDAAALGGLLDLGAPTLRLSPLAHGTDGFFVASLRRRS